MSSVEDADEAAIPAVRNRVGPAPVGPGARRGAGGSPWVALRVAVVRVLHAAVGRHWRSSVDDLGLDGLCCACRHNRRLGRDTISRRDDDISVWLYDFSCHPSVL